MSVGVICGSLPHLPSLFRRYSLNLSHVSSVIHLLFHGYKTESRKSSELPLNDFDRVNSDSTDKKVQVETQVLGSIQGYVELRSCSQTTSCWVGKCHVNPALGMASSFRLGDSHKPGDMILERNPWRAMPKILLLLQQNSQQLRRNLKQSQRSITCVLPFSMYTTVLVFASIRVFQLAFKSAYQVSCLPRSYATE